MNHTGGETVGSTSSSKMITTLRQQKGGGTMRGADSGLIAKMPHQNHTGSVGKSERKTTGIGLKLKQQ